MSSITCDSSVTTFIVATPNGRGDASHAERLGDAIAELAARLHAATYELLVLLRQFDEACGWNTGFRSCAHWLHWRTGIDLGAAREKVRVAHALAPLPRLSAAMQRGEVSYAKVRAVSRVATPDNEAQLLDVARCGTAAHVERLVRAWRRVDRVEATRQAEVRHLERQLTTWVDDGGMVVLRGRLTPEVGAVVQRALEAAADRLRCESVQAPRGDALGDDVTAGQRRADALGLLAECALATDLDRGTAGDRYQVVLHVEADRSPVLPSSADPPADANESAGDVSAETYDPLPPGTWVDSDVRLWPRRSALSDDGPRNLGHAVVEVGEGAVCVSTETCERFTCYASMVVMRHDAGGSPLDVGRKTRSIPPAIRRALAARDPWCQFPGCTARRCDAHHITHWAHGGPTNLDNLVHLCRWHHRAVHEGGYQIARDPGGSIRVLRRDGTRLPHAPALPPTERLEDDALAPTSAHLDAIGVTIGPYTAMSAWDGHPFDVGWAIDVLRGRPVDAPAVSDPGSDAGADRHRARSPLSWRVRPRGRPRRSRLVPVDFIQQREVQQVLRPARGALVRDEVLAEDGAARPCTSAPVADRSRWPSSDCFRKRSAGPRACSTRAGNRVERTGSGQCASALRKPNLAVVSVQ